MTTDVTITFTAQQIADLMITAFEGGVTYWCGSAVLLTEHANLESPWYATPHLYDQDFRIELADCEDEETSYHFTREMIQPGFERMSKSYPQYFGRIMAGSYDAADADVFLQCVVFNEVIYG